MRVVTAAHAPDLEGTGGIDRRITSRFPKARTAFFDEFRASREGLVRTRIGVNYRIALVL